MREPPGPLWGRAVLLCRRGVCGVLVAPLVFRAPEGPAAREARRPHFVRRRASKPARALRSLRRPPHRRRMLGASSRSPARPATAHRHCGSSLRCLPHQWGLVCCWLARRQLWLSTSNFARNSSMTHSNIEFASLELQRFWGISKNDHDKLRAKFGWRWCRCCLWAPLSGPPVPPAPSMPAASSPNQFRMQFSRGSFKP